ncbi:helix-turn-helix domain-containing protein [Mucilaginibacter aquaedulcis]|uniref:helix-turn-helix domain-containing protein n=1 Tax=Mucilaginibacter aquaedulcis TaxID=1187081 RepID=UPI0025B6095B|nr:helix-turn-helix transcriptional regulator [Mucilaginibacter aquaedulcis]MDN3548908.1 helix-turn-helix transcriptional regulator [Mucilaginibacter aquaedulcis]
MINIKDERLIKSFGLKLREFRNAQGLSQEILANLANMPLSQIGRIERGLINPTLSTIGALSTALDIPIKDFFS